MENRKPKVCTKGCSQTDLTNFKIAKKQEWRSKDVDRVRLVVIAVMRIMEKSKSPSFVSTAFLAVGMDNFSDAEDVLFFQLRKVIQVKLDKMVIKKIPSQGTENDGNEWTVMPLSQSTINSQVECGRRKSRVYFNEGLHLPKPLLPPTPDCSENLDLLEFASKDVLSSSMEIEEVSRRGSEVYLQDVPVTLLHSKQIESQNLDSIEAASKDSNPISVEIEEIPLGCTSDVHLIDGVEQKLRLLSLPLNNSQKQNLDSMEIASGGTYETPINIEDIPGRSVESQCASGYEDYPPKSEILAILMTLSPALENSVPVIDENTWFNSASFRGNNTIRNYPSVEVDAPSVINTFEAPVPVYGLMGLFYPVENTVASYSTMLFEHTEPHQMSVMTSVQHSDSFIKETDFNPAMTQSGAENLDCSCTDTPQSLPLTDYPVSKSSTDSDHPTENYPPAEEIVEILHSLDYIPGL